MRAKSIGTLASGPMTENRCTGHLSATVKAGKPSASLFLLKIFAILPALTPRAGQRPIVVRKIQKSECVTSSGAGQCSPPI